MHGWKLSQTTYLDVFNREMCLYISDTYEKEMLKPFAECMILMNRAIF
jgi:hypothetical protein